MRKLISILAAVILTLGIAAPVVAWEDSDPREQHQWATVYPSTMGGGQINEVPVCLLSNFDAPNGGWDGTVARIARIQNAISEVNSYDLGFNYKQTNTACANMNPNSKSGYVFLQVGYGDCQGSTRIACWKAENWNFFCITHCLRKGSILFQDNGSPELAGFDWYVGGSNTYSGGKWGFEEIALHEFGHSLALDHNGVPHSSIMCSTDITSDCDHFERIFAGVGSETMQPWFHNDDVTGINAMWP